MQQYGLIPNLFAYNTLISVCEKAGRVEQALQLFEDMRQTNVLPDSSTYLCLIRACEKGGNPERAKQLAQQMKAQDFRTNSGAASGPSTSQRGERKRDTRS